MGTWGYRLEENDTFCEVKEAFRERLQAGETPDQAAEALDNAYRDESDAHIAQLALADCLWRENALTDRRLQAGIAAAGVDASYCRQLGADAQFLQNRAKALQRFLRKLEGKPPKCLPIQEAPRITLQKGDCFWYRQGGRIFGGLILECQPEEFSEGMYFLIALSEELEHPPKSKDEILCAVLFTLAWFSETDLLPPKRLHWVGRETVTADFRNRYGLRIDRAGDSCTNIGQRATWTHEFWAMRFRNMSLSELLTRG